MLNALPKYSVLENLQHHKVTVETLMFSPRSLTKNMYPLPTITVYLVCELNVNTETPKILTTLQLSKNKQTKVKWLVTSFLGYREDCSDLWKSKSNCLVRVFTLERVYYMHLLWNLLPSSTTDILWSRNSPLPAEPHGESSLQFEVASSQHQSMESQFVPKT